jgi:flagellar protein FliL
VATKPEAPKPEAAEAAVAAPKSKKMLLIVVALLVLGLAGGAAWFLLAKKNAPVDDEEEIAAPAHEVSHAPPTYLPLDNMVVNLADPGGEKVAQVGVTLELADSKAPEKVRLYLPAIRSGILLLLSQRTAEELLQREGKEKLAADILAEASRHFESDGSHGKAEGAKAKKKKPDTKGDDGENPVRGVLFSSFIIQ